MKSVAAAIALISCLACTAFAAEDLAPAKSTSVKGLHHGKSHRHVYPEEAVVTIFGGSFIMRRMDCDYTGNGAARLDTCAVDGMAAGGSNFNKRNHRGR